MVLPLIHGQFSKTDVLDLMTQLVQVKIRFHENKIKASHHEEDIKMRETRIKELQKSLYEIKKNLEFSGNNLSMQSQIEIK
jgi:hypothetical protein